MLKGRINMRILKGIVISLAFAAFIMTLAPAARADQGDWATQVTFSGPIQIGDIVLTPGTYLFRLADIWAPDFVMIYNADTHSYLGIVRGIRAYRSTVSENTTFTRREVNGSPEELEYWYYPDQNVGIKFSSPRTGETVALVIGKRLP